jgi:hypothetical protein
MHSVAFYGIIFLLLLLILKINQPKFYKNKIIYHFLVRKLQIGLFYVLKLGILFVGVCLLLEHK